MDRLAELIIEGGYAERVLTERQLARIVGGSDESRYALVKRAVKAGALTRIKRGLYVLAGKFRKQPVHPFHLAQALVAGSYVSMESALAYHGWIPETVPATISVSPGRKSAELDHTQFGRFYFRPLAVEKLAFLEDVERITIGNQTMLVAKPLRALMDLAAHRKLAWQGLDWIVSGLRIDAEHLVEVPKREFVAMRRVYKHKAVIAFLMRLDAEVADLKAQRKAVQEGETGDE
jgi:predicted transcriptional regulator of viral defense system